MLAVAFCPDGKRLISSDRAGFVYVWDWRAARLVRDWRGGRAEIPKLSVHPDGQRIAGVVGVNAQIWDMAGNPLSDLLKGDSHILQLTFDPSGDFLSGGSYNGQVYLWQTETGQMVRLLRGHRAPNGLAFFPGGQWLVTGSGDQTVGIWDVTSGRLRHQLSGHRRSIASLAISPDGTRLAYGGNGKTFYVSDTTNLQTVQEWSSQDQVIMSLAFHPRGRLLASGATDSSVRLWNSESGVLEAALWGHNWAVERVLFHPQRPLLVSAALDGEICVWDTGSGGMASRTDAHSKWISDLIFSADGEQLISCGGDQRICFWSVTGDASLRKTGEMEIPVEAGYGPLLALLDDRHLAFGSEQGVHLHNLNTDQPVALLTGHDPWITALAASRDGRLLASIGVEKSLCLWEGTNGRLRWRQEIEHLTQTIAFSPDGSRLYTGSAEGIVDVWDTSSGQPIARRRIPDPYEGMNIRGVRGINEAQRASLLALGAVER